MPRRIIQAWHGFQFELFCSVFCMLLGLPLAGGLASPNSVTSQLPKPAQILWGVSLFLGGLSVLAGILWRQYSKKQFVAGLYLESGGLWMLATAVLAFTILIMLYAGIPSIFTSGINGAFIAACLSRISSIRKEISIIREHGEVGS